jgi:hypothetical protein
MTSRHQDRHITESSHRRLRPPPKPSSVRPAAQSLSRTDPPNKALVSLSSDCGVGRVALAQSDEPKERSRKNMEPYRPCQSQMYQYHCCNTRESEKAGLPCDVACFAASQKYTQYSPSARVSMHRLLLRIPPRCMVFSLCALLLYDGVRWVSCDTAWFLAPAGKSDWLLSTRAS